jgi:hypothetical protein
VNFPLLDDNGEVEFIVHHVEDVTASVLGSREQVPADKRALYAEKIRECEQAARRMRDPRLREQMLELAEQWRRMSLER